MSNGQPASLLDAIASTFGPTPQDDINPIIDQYILRQGAPYLSPAYIVQSFPTLGPFGVPYWMQGLAVQTCTGFTDSPNLGAPRPYQNAQIFHHAQNALSAGQYGIGQAPTKGVFTGVEDSC